MSLEQPEPGYLILAIAISGLITLLLRALPFAILKKLKGSKFVIKLGLWMPVGIMLILALSTSISAFNSRPEIWWSVPVCLAATIATHLITKRNTTISVLVGTALYVFIVNFF